MPENKKKTRGNLAVMGRLVGLVKPLAPVMVAAVLLGVAGFLCAIFITVLGAYALLDSILPGMPISLGTVCLLLPVLRCGKEERSGRFRRGAPSYRSRNVGIIRRKGNAALSSKQFFPIRLRWH